MEVSSWCFITSLLRQESRGWFQLSAESNALFISFLFVVLLLLLVWGSFMKSLLHGAHVSDQGGQGQSLGCLVLSVNTSPALLAGASLQGCPGQSCGTATPGGNYSISHQHPGVPLCCQAPCPPAALFFGLQAQWQCFALRVGTFMLSFVFWPGPGGSTQAAPRVENFILLRPLFCNILGFCYAS